MKMYQLEAIFFFSFKKYLQFLAYKLYATIFIAVRSYFKLQVPSPTQSEYRLRARSSNTCVRTRGCTHLCRYCREKFAVPTTPGVYAWELTLEVQSHSKIRPSWPDAGGSALPHTTNLKGAAHTSCLSIKFSISTLQHNWKRRNVSNNDVGTMETTRLIYKTCWKKKRNPIQYWPGTQK